ncbi:MAG: hypothetical protein P8Q36_06340 [Alphaproteobacteria bacterium]|jgi:adenylate cyclase|nr:hypothetical protein [Rhodospirillaceae bacterium]MBT6512196.1 hypothetical protein [Rhodospirillaceae bacterium]MBT7615156.1 hypothetical protein [Rhodospirillaceae bacterium]MBT7648952.1 hypothetical protein [Rhodospirillaceae bacterium]MDG2480476.1 hypothetical protein [Alphaproteobacteria bacterium]
MTERTTMSDQSMFAVLEEKLSRGRGGGLSDDDLANADPFIREALIENKRTGLLLAVRARWVAMAIIAVLIPFLNPTVEILYYEAALGVFSLIGWAQLRAGRVTQSRPELGLIFVDLALMTFLLVFPNPWRLKDWPTAFQFTLSEFSYFYVILAAATLAYSWRTIVAIGTWTTGLWATALILVALFGTQMPDLSERIAQAVAGHERILAAIDPNDPGFPDRVQELVIFLIVAGILAVNGRRNTRLVFQQANLARERANLARHFPPSTVDQMAEQNEPLGAVRSQDA